MSRNYVHFNQTLLNYHSIKCSYFVLVSVISVLSVLPLSVPVTTPRSGEGSGEGLRFLASAMSMRRCLVFFLSSSLSISSFCRFSSSSALMSKGLSLGSMYQCRYR